MIIGSQMRVEYKCKNKEAVTSFLMIDTVQDLIDNWESLNDIYNNNLRNFIFV